MPPKTARTGAQSTVTKGIYSSYYPKERKENTNFNTSKKILMTNDGYPLTSLLLSPQSRLQGGSNNLAESPNHRRRLLSPDEATHRIRAGCSHQYEEQKHFRRFQKEQPAGVTEKVPTVGGELME